MALLPEEEDDGIPIEVEDEPTELPRRAPEAENEPYEQGYFGSQIDREYARSKRYGHALSVLLLDVDQLAKYNKRHGQARGDRVLEAVYEMLTETLRAPDLLCRIGGDDFAIVATDTDEEQGMALGHRLVKRCEELAAEQELPPFTVTVGVASLPSTRYARAWDLVEAAELAVAAAKRAGRNRAQGAE